MQTFSFTSDLLPLLCFVVNIIMGATQIWLALYVFNQKLKRRYRKRVSRRARILPYAVLGLIVVWNAVVPGLELAWVYPIIMGFSLLLYLLMFRLGKLVYKLFWLYIVVVFYVISFTTAFFLATLLYNLSVQFINAIPTLTLILLITSALFSLVCYLLGRQKRFPLEISPLSILAIILLPTVSLGALAFMVYDYFGCLMAIDVTARTPAPFLETVGAPVLFAVNIFVLILHDYVLTKSGEGFNEQSRLREAELTRVHYEELQSLYGATRTWRHDYGNHLQAIEGLIEAKNYDELSNYVGELKGSLSQINFRIRSGSELLDAFLSAKTSYAESLGILFSLEISVDMADVSMSAIDITSLIGNVVDNAIEACQRIEDENIKPEIQMKISRSKDQLVIYVKNSKEGKIVLDDQGNLVTSKKEGDHGIGTRQIGSIIKKYGGYIDHSTDETTFETFVTLQLKKN